jgi:integrase
MARAVIWGMLKENPFKKGDPLQVKEDNKRDRYLSEEEILTLLAECPVQEAPRQKGRLIQGSQAIHLRDFVIISINTGMQKSEVLSLKWDQIRRGLIYLPKIKSRPARKIPVNDDLAAHFKLIKKKQPVGSKCVISDSRGRPIKDIKTAFASALKRAGIQDCRPHDLRHTFASHYVMRGGTLAALAKILGHTKISTTMRYAHLSKDFARKEMEQLNGLTSGKKKEDGHKMVTSSLSENAVAS